MNTSFYIENGNHKIKADVLTYFELSGDYYCVYTVKNEDYKDSFVYCAKVVNGNLVPISDRQEVSLTSKVVGRLIGAMEG